MPVSIFTHALPAALSTYAQRTLSADERAALKADLPGASLRGAHRDEHRAALGIVLEGDMLTAPYRHNLPRNVLKRGKVSGDRRAALEALHGADVLAAALEAGMCPALAALGISTAEQEASARDNGKVADRDLRADTVRCPYCLAADVLAKIRAGAERDADAIWYGADATS